MVRREGQAVPAADPLLRRRRDQALRRGALPPARGGLRRARAPRRRLPRVADRLRRDGAVLHARRAALPGPRRARRGPDRAAVERALPVPRRQPRAAHPAARRRPRGRRPPPVPRALRRDARRGEHAVRALRALRDLRRLPVPRARQVRRRGARRPPRARAPQRHAAHERRGRAARDQRARHARSPASWSSATAPARPTRATSWSSPAARRTARGCCSPPASDAHPAGLANGSDQVGRNYMFHNSQAVLALSKEPNPTVFQKTLGLNDFYFASGDIEYPLGNIQMVGKSSAEMYRGEKPIQTKLAPERTLAKVAEHAVDFWLSTEDLPRPENRVTLRPDGRIALAYTPTNEDAEEAALPRAEVDARAPRHAPRPPAAAPRLPQERDPGRRRRAPGGHVPLRRGPRDVGARHATAARTRSTTSTSSTRASSRASAPSTRR